MINVCPQCKAPIPREVSRFCNQCGADLRALLSAPLGPIDLKADLKADLNVDLDRPGASLEPYETPSEIPERAVAPNSAALRQSLQRTTMVVPKDDATLPRPEAMVRIVMRDGSVAERDITQNEVSLGKG